MRVDWLLPRKNDYGRRRLAAVLCLRSRMESAGKEPRKPSWDDRFKSVALALGVVSTALGLFVAVKAQFIDKTLGETKQSTDAIQRKLQDQELQLKAQELKTKAWDTSARLVLQWHVMTANEFARSMEDPASKIVWPDLVLRQQIAAAAPSWRTRAHLMGRAEDDGLLLRQIICLRLLNIGNSPAQKLVMQTSALEFGGQQQGEPANLYGELASDQGEALELNLGNLMDAGQRAHGLITEIVIPLAHVVGSRRYVGRVLLPSSVTWVDERQGTNGNLSIDPRDTFLSNRLMGGDLGRTKGKVRL